MKHRLKLIFILSQLVFLSGFAQQKTTLEIKNNWYYLNGERFFYKSYWL